MSTTTLTERVYTALAAGEQHDALYAAANHDAQTEHELNLADWGMTLGIAYGIARGEDPYESPAGVIARAESAASEAWARWHGSEAADVAEVK